MYAECLNAVSRGSRGACDRIVDETYSRIVAALNACLTTAGFAAPVAGTVHIHGFYRISYAVVDVVQTADSCQNIVIILNFARKYCMFLH